MRFSHFTSSFEQQTAAQNTRPFDAASIDSHNSIEREIDITEMTNYKQQIPDNADDVLSMPSGTIRSSEANYVKRHQRNSPIPSNRIRKQHPKPKRNAIINEINERANDRKQKMQERKQATKQQVQPSFKNSYDENLFYSAGKNTSRQMRR
jgi:hypothetical protein